MTDLQFIHSLMRRNTTGLAMLAPATIAARWIHRGLYVIQLARRNYQLGFLLYAEPNEEHTLYINHADLDLSPTNHLSAKRAVLQLVGRAHHRNARNILFRAPSDVNTIAFWKHCKFTPIAVTATGGHTQQSTVQYELVLPTQPQKLASGPLPEALRPKV